MSEPSEYDYDLIGNNALDLMKKNKKKEGRGIWAYSSLETVKKNISDLVEFEQNIHLIQGKVEDTLPNNKKLPKKISLLRLDTDFYESTKIELEILYPLLAKGGVLIIDDYGHFQGAKKAVDDYFAKQKIWLKYVDYTCRLYIKE
jgi:O-methyltransferase